MHCLLVWNISGEKSAVIHILDLLCVMYHFIVATFKFHLYNWCQQYGYDFFLPSCVGGLLSIWNILLYNFCQVWSLSDFIFQIFLVFPLSINIAIISVCPLPYIIQFIVASSFKISFVCLIFGHFLWYVLKFTNS